MALHTIITISPIIMMKLLLLRGPGPELDCLQGRVKETEPALGCGLVHSRAQHPPSCNDRICEKRWGPPESG